MKTLMKIVLKGVLSLITFVLLAFVLFHIVEDIRGKRVLTQHKRECVARGENIGDWQSLIPSPIPDDDNIAMAPIFQDLIAGERRVHLPDLSSSVRTVSGLVWQTGKYENLDKWRVAFSNDNLLTALSVYDDDLREIGEALKRPLYHSKEWDNMSKNSISGPPASLVGYPAHRFASIYSLRARARLEAKQYSDALEDVKFGFRLASLEQADPTCISVLHRIGTLNIMLPPLWIGIHERVWDVHQLRTLQELLESINLADHAARAIQLESRFALSFRQTHHAERADGISFEDTDIRGGRVLWEGALAPLLLSRISILQESALPPFAKFIFRLIPKGWFEQNAVRYAQLCDRLSSAINADTRLFDVPTTKREDAAITAIIMGGKIHIYSIAVEAYSGAFPKMMKRGAKMQSTIHQAVIACAIERYRFEHGRIPQRLDELVPTFLSKIPNDPIDGQQIRYKLSGDNGYVLYSIGWNETDDNGELAWMKKYEWSRHTIDIDNGDWIWRSYPVDDEKGQLVLPEGTK